MLILDRLLSGLHDASAAFPDKRKGAGDYSMADIGLSAFSLFFMQSESFLAYQRSLEEGRASGADFLLAARPESHKALYDFMKGAACEEVTIIRKEGARKLSCHYRWFSKAPLRDGKEASSSIGSGSPSPTPRARPL